jgi:hypothetical protein
MFYRQCNNCGVRKELGDAWSCKCQPESKKEWVGLTDEERKQVRSSAHYNQFMTAGEYAEAVQKNTEAKLKEKNHG